MKRSAAAAAAAFGIAIAVGIPTAAQAADYDVEPAAPMSDYSVQGTLTELGGLLYFPAQVGVGPTTLWSLDPATSTAAPVATAQDGEFEDPAFATADASVVWFLGNRASLGGTSALYAYDPTADTATPFASSGTTSIELAVVDGVPYTAGGDGFVHTWDVSNPAAPPTPLAPIACTNLATYTQARGVTAIGDRLAFSGSCGPTERELFLYDPATGTTTNAYRGTTFPTGADLSGPAEFAELDGFLYFSAGYFANDQRLYRYDEAAAVITAVDPSLSNPGRPFLFEGAVTWLAVDATPQSVVVQLVGGVPTRLPITDDGGLLAALDAVPWSGRLLLNGFYDTVGGGDATAYAYDPADGVITRLTPDGADFIAPFVAADGTGYIAGEVGPNIILFRVALAVTPAPPAPPVPVLPATGFGSGPALAAASVLALGLGVGGILLLRRAARHR